jgi:hypothetical protein
MAQHPYGQPAGPGPYWQPQPPAPAPRSNVALIVVIVVLAVVLLLAGAGAALWFLRSNSATVTTTQPPASAATCAGGDTVTDPQYAYKAPPGWCVDENGLGVRTKTINVITVTKVPMTGKFEQTALCDQTTGKLGPYTKLPSTPWGGRKAETYTVTSGIAEGPMWCLVDSRYQYTLSGTVGGWGTMDEVEAGVAQVIASWTWT